MKSAWNSAGEWHVDHAVGTFYRMFSQAAAHQRVPASTPPRHPGSAISWRFASAVLALSLVPLAFRWLGPNLTLTDAEVDEYMLAALKHDAADFEPYLKLRGELVHALFEWTGVCLACMTGASALLHYLIKRDVATPIVGMALLCCGLIDAFHTLTAMLLFAVAADFDRFVPFTWTLSRIFHSLILTVGISIVLWRGRGLKMSDEQRNRMLVLSTIFFVIIAYAMIHFCAVAPRLPGTIFPDATVPRPLDALALVIYLIAGGVLLPRFHRRHGSLFSQGLLLSLGPHILGQACAAFLSRSEVDDAFLAAQYLKVVGYGIPLVGLMIDYTRAYRAEATLRVTEEKLDIARVIQRGLLPNKPPQIAGFDVAGRSDSPAAVGGDYFDYIQLSDGSWGIILGDVSGHDLGASLLMSQTRAYLRALAVSSTDLLSVLEQLNRFIARDVRERRFVSLILVRIWPNTNEARYVGAGQSGMIVRPERQHEMLPVTSPVLGLNIGEAQSEGAFTLQPGEMLALFSDGITEARAPDGTMFGNERLLNLLADASAEQLSADATAAKVVSRVEAHCGEQGFEDDLTLVILRRTNA